jgi:hypothetical protein
VDVARRHGAFEVAVNALTAGHPALALQLRRLWVLHLAERGDFPKAVHVAWQQAELRPMARPLLERALAEDTPSGARLLRLLLAEEGGFERVREHIERLSGRDGMIGARMRIAAAEGLAEGPEGHRLARAAVRAALADHGRWPGLVDAQQIRKVVAAVGDPALATDLPGLIGSTPGFTRAGGGPLRVEVARGDVGLSAVSDLAPGPDGSLLVALGEAGAVLLGADGRRRARFEEPVTTLVAMHGTARALGVHRRSWGVRTSRFDLAAGTATRWIDGSFGAFAPESDGGLWLVAEGRSVLALDLVADHARAIWRVANLDADVTAVSWGPGGMTFMIAGREYERWIHRAGDLRLLHRSYWEPYDARWATTLAADGTFTRATLVPDPASKQLELRWMQQAPTATKAAAIPGVGPLPLPQGHHVLDGVAARGARLAASLVGDDAARVYLWDGGELVLDVALGGAQRVCMRLDDGSFAVGDDRGRVLSWDLLGKARSGDWRV